MSATRHSRDGAVNVLRDGLFLGIIGYSNRNGSAAVVSQDEAVDYLVREGYNVKYATRVLSDAYNRGDVGRVGRGLYLFRSLV